MKHEFQGYGGMKMWEWGMRCDIPSVSQGITAGDIYITPFNMDSIYSTIPIGIKGK